METKLDKAAWREWTRHPVTEEVIKFINSDIEMNRDYLAEGISGNVKTLDELGYQVAYHQGIVAGLRSLFHIVEQNCKLEDDNG